MIAAFFLTQLRHWLRPADLWPKPVSTPFVLVCADGEVAGVQGLVPEAALAEVERDRLKMEFAAMH